MGSAVVAYQAIFLRPASSRMYRAATRTRPSRNRPSFKRGTVCKEGGMYVPSDSFNGLSPERKASQAMVAFFTFVAVRVVMAQLEGSGRGSLGSYNAKASEDLTNLLQEMPLKDGDAWIEALMRRNELLGVRIMEVRTAYAKEDFEWHNMEKISVKELEERNVKLMRGHASRAFAKALQMEASDKQ